MTKWPAHLEERAAIFELTGADSEPLKGPTRTLLLWEEDTFVELDPASWRVLEVGTANAKDAVNHDCR